MRDQRLLERLRTVEADPDARTGFDAERLYVSVLAHLRRILNTKQGSALISDDFGMPDFSDLAGRFDSTTVRDLEQAIMHVIQTYEPRLSSVRVSSEFKETDRLSLQFKVEARIALKDRDIPVSFETHVDPRGRVDVSK